MKRYRVNDYELDSRAAILAMPIEENWSEDEKALHQKNKANMGQSLIQKFGILDNMQKQQNFLDIGPKLPSIIAFHNKFLEQIRSAFVMNSYYPSLTGACALGERILNHLLLCLREYFKHTSEYKAVYNKDSFDDWKLAINTLKAWDILLDPVVADYTLLMDMRNRAIHFRPETDSNDRTLAIGAILLLQKIIANQFAASGPQPWFITDIPGEVYIKKEWESRPFIKEIYLPSCQLVGPQNRMVVYPHFMIDDNNQYDERSITDAEFVQLRKLALVKLTRI